VNELEEERMALYQKILLLHQYIETDPEFREMGDRGRDRLRMQLYFMRGYDDALRERIRAIKRDV
jgi:hypothetical protein